MTKPLLEKAIPEAEATVYVPDEETGKEVMVSAPSDLAAGYQFEAEYEGRKFNGKVLYFLKNTCATGGFGLFSHIHRYLLLSISYKVTVPAGGVTKGQQILVRLGDDILNPPPPAQATAQPTSSGSSHSVPTGAWRDGLCDCCSEGCFEGGCWLTWCCSGVSLAQLLTRMKMNFMGQYSPNYKNTFLIVSLIYLIEQNVLPAFTYRQQCFTDEDGIVTCVAINANTLGYTMLGLAVVLFWYFFALGFILRSNMREAFNIPGSCLGDFFTVSITSISLCISLRSNLF